MTAENFPRVEPTMMKGSTTLHQTRFVSVLRTDGIIHRLTNHDRPYYFERGGITGRLPYHPQYGLKVGPIRSEQGLKDKTCEMSALYGDGFGAPSYEDVYAGKLDRARVFINAGDWRWGSFLLSMQDSMFVTDVQKDELGWTVQLGGWTVFLKRRKGNSNERLCGNELGNYDGVESFCKVDLTQHPLRVVTTVVNPGTYTADRKNFRLQETAGSLFTATHEENYFEFGWMEVLGGKNRGIRRRVYSNSDATSFNYSDIVVSNAFPFPLETGTSVIINAGCDKLESTCRFKFNNYDDFRGSPWIPGSTSLIRGGQPIS